ncbi:MAG: hypothetical protein ACKO8Z_13965, partial [Prosthecobacter sp.]
MTSRCLSVSRAVLILVIALLTTTFLQAAPPTAPTGFSTSMTYADSGTIVMRCEWTDNSTDED